MAPLGLLSVASSMPGGVEIVDLNVCNDPLRMLSEKLDSLKPDVVGISLRNADTTNAFDPYSYLPAFLLQLRIVAERAPRAEIRAGGAGYSLFHRELEAEARVISEGTVGHHENSIPLPSWDLIDLEPYLPFQKNLSIGVEVSRGCDLNCSYCVYPSLSGVRKQDKPPEDIRSEVLMLRARGVRHLFLCAPVLNHRPGRGEEVAQAMAGTGVTWEAYHSPLGFSESYASLARESGCTAISFSPDGGSDFDMKALGKDFTTRDVRIAVGNASREGLKVYISLFPYLPWSSPVAMSRAFISGRRWGKVAGAGLARLRFGAVRRLPGSAFGPGKPALHGAVPPGEFVLPQRPWMTLFRFFRAAFEKRPG
ncbi:MAG: radical SAM protein [Candidatus Fermentibacteraceae bacterium]